MNLDPGRLGSLVLALVSAALVLAGQAASDGALVLTGGVAGVLAVGLFRSSSRFPISRGKHPTASAAIADLTDDVNHCKVSTLVFSANCSLANASDEERRGLLEAIRRRGHEVQLRLVTQQPPHPELLALASAEKPFLVIDTTDWPIPFTGRIIDGETVVRYRESRALDDSRGEYLRAENAGDVAAGLRAALGV